MEDLELPGWLVDPPGRGTRPAATRHRARLSLLSHLSQLATVVAIAVTLTVSAITGLAHAVGLVADLHQLTAAVRDLDRTLVLQEARTDSLERGQAALTARAGADEHTTDNLERRLTSLEVARSNAKE